MLLRPLLLFLIIGIFSCKPPSSKREMLADLSLLAQQDQGSVEMMSGRSGGGMKSTEVAKVKWEGLQLSSSGKYIALEANTDSSYLEFVPQAISLPASWQDYKQMVLSYRSTEDKVFQMQTSIHSPRGFIDTLVSIQPNAAGTLVMDIREIVLISRGKAKVPPVSVRMALWGQDGLSPSISFHELKLINDPSLSPHLADVFGQRMKGKWENKITDISQLRQQAQQEVKALAGVKLPEGRDKFGGWSKGPSFKATGFFRLEQGETKNAKTHWWLIDPLGNPFWSLGVTGVRHKFPISRSELTIYKGREQLFSQLPSQAEYPEVYQGDMFSLYAWNLIRKWGSIDAWREIAAQRAAAWGLNSLGNWSDEGVLAKSKLPYTRFFNSNGEGVSKLGESKLVDVFDPSWAVHLDSSFSIIQQYKQDSLLIGYFVDNEQGWGNPNLLEKAHATSFLRKRWEEILQSKYPDLLALNKAWQTAFSSWDEVSALGGDQVPNAQFMEDYTELERQYAEAYFSQIAGTLKKYDPNHLYLGCRFTKRLKPAHIVAEAGKYCDAITINNYSLVPTAARMDQWHRLSGNKAILIGEHHLPLKSERQLPPRYQNFSAEERFKYYQAYVEGWASMPYSIGSHWYQWVDQPLTGRASDGENQTVGLVDIVDQPHTEMVDAIGILSKNIYKWHANSQ